MEQPPEKPPEKPLGPTPLDYVVEEIAAQNKKRESYWKKSENYWPYKNYHQDLIMSYSALTDMIHPHQIDAQYGDVRELDGLIFEQSFALHELCRKLFQKLSVGVHAEGNDGDKQNANGYVDEKKLAMVLRTQKQFRDSFLALNNVFARRYQVTTSKLPGR